jgi:hypothetical protein
MAGERSTTQVPVEHGPDSSAPYDDSDSDAVTVIVPPENGKGPLAVR